MATANLNTTLKEIVIRETKEVPTDISLSLSIEEAFTLHTILRGVGGCIWNSARKFSQPLCNALNELLPEMVNEEKLMKPMECVLTFYDGSQDEIKKEADCFRSNYKPED